MMNPNRFRTLRRLRRKRGMTLVEIMIVVIIMALIATAVGVAVLPRLRQARIDSTRTDSRTIADSAIAYIAEHPGGECPSVADLVDEDYIDESRRTVDAWDHDFSIECNGDDVLVVSAGPDGQMGNEDDVSSDQGSGGGDD